MFMRFTLSMGFFLYHAAFSVSLKERFAFTARQQSFFMAYVGLLYALSQYFVAKPIMHWYGDAPTKPLLVCIAGLAMGRYLAFVTSQLWLMLLGMGVVVVAIGVVNTVISTVTSKVVAADHIGAVYGLMQTVENVAGLVGPSAGGYLATLHPYAPLASVQFLYALLAAVLVTLFRYFVLPAMTLAASKTKAE